MPKVSVQSAELVAGAVVVVVVTGALVEAELEPLEQSGQLSLVQTRAETVLSLVAEAIS